MAKKKRTSKKASPRKKRPAKKSRGGVKLLKYPKRPKASASTTVLENYLKRVKEIDAENSRRQSLFASIKKVIGK